MKRSIVADACNGLPGPILGDFDAARGSSQPLFDRRAVRWLTPIPAHLHSNGPFLPHRRPPYRGHESGNLTGSQTRSCRKFGSGNIAGTLSVNRDCTAHSTIACM